MTETSRLATAVIATGAICIGGTAEAARLITGKQIKNGSIGLVDISKPARQALHGSRGATGLPGAPGAPGQQGPQGTAGASASTSVQRIQGADTVVASGGSGTAEAACPSGMKVVGGGFIGTSNVQITREDSGDLSTWSVGVKNTGGGQSVTDAVVFCLG